MVGKFVLLGALSALCSLIQASPLQPRAAATPTLRSATEVGYVASYPTLNRDSMVGTQVGNRYFWISRDATTFDGQCCFIIASAASWTNLNSDGSPFLTNGVNQTTYGDNNYTSYFRTPYGQFPPNGFGDNFERYINWPDTPPLPVSDPTNNRIKLYTWSRNVHQLNATSNAPGNPQTILYRSDYYTNSDGNTLPPVTVVGYPFWPAETIPFGNYGWVISPSDGFAYLYGRSSSMPRWILSSTCLRCCVYAVKSLALQVMENAPRHARSWTRSMRRRARLFHIAA